MSLATVGLVTLPSQGAQAATSFATATSWKWTFAELANASASPNEFVQAQVSGNTDKDKNAALVLRKSGANDFLLVNYSGTRYQVMKVTSGAYTTLVDLPFSPGGSAIARVEVSGGVVRGFWNGKLVDSRNLPAVSAMSGTSTSLGVWQNNASAVAFTGATAGPLDTAPAPTTTTPTSTTTPTTSPAPTTATTSSPPSSWSSALTWQWNWTPLAISPTSANSYVQATVSGLTDADKNGALVLRRSSADTFVAVNFSGKRYQVLTVKGGQMSGHAEGAADFTKSGVARAELSGTTVRVYWNGGLIGTHAVAEIAGFAGVGAGLGAWQNVSNAVKLSQVTAGNLTGATPTTTTTAPTSTTAPTTTTPVTTAPTTPPVTTTAPSTTAPSTSQPSTGVWLSGAASPQAANGTFGDWRGEKLGIGGTWVNGNTYMLTLDTLQPGKEWGAWTGAMDVAIGAIEYGQGETWAKAATGSYDARWLQSAKNLKAVWTDKGKPEGNLYIRFAHEFNGNWFQWRVKAGEEGSFVTAWKRYHAILKSVLPKAKLVWCPNYDSSAGYADTRAAWPGKAYVDIYSIDVYNFYPFETTQAAIEKKMNSRYSNGTPTGLETHRQEAQSMGVPFAISEWSNSALNDTGGGGEAPLFMEVMNNWMRKNAGTGPGQVVYDVLFNLWNRFAIYGPEAHQPVTSTKYRDLVWGK